MASIDRSAERHEARMQLSQVEAMNGSRIIAACNGHRALRWPVPLMPRSVSQMISRIAVRYVGGKHVYSE